MSKRLNKRQAREQQELQELNDLRLSPPAPSATVTASAADSDPDGDHDDVGAVTAPQSRSVFAALGGDDQADDQEGEEDLEIAQAEMSESATSSKKKNKKKKKKSTSAAAVVAAADLEAGRGGEAGTATDGTKGASTPSTSTSKSAKKKAGKAGQTTKGISDMSLDDFDSILASQPHISAAAAAGGVRDMAAATSTPSSTTSLRASLSLQQNHLDPDVELRRQFGSAALKAYEASNGGSNGSAGAGGARARMLARNPNLKLRSVLVQPKETWPPVNRTFTGMVGDIVEDPTTSAKIATWEHSKAYRAAQYEFQQAVATYDPQAIYALVKPYPWHVHVLSSLSDISKHQGDLGQASDWNARILFVYERTASPTFISSLTNPAGPLPVDFKKVENRGLYLAAHRMIAFLGRRGTWRTALEWSKFLLSLDEADPHACLLWIDFLAIKSKQHRWLVEEFLPRLRKARDVNWAAGLDFAEALGVRALEREGGDRSGQGSTPLLKKAIIKHPYVLPALYGKLSLDLPSGMASDPCVQAASSASGADEADALREIVSQIYSARNDSLWKDVELKTWLRSTVESVWSDRSSSSSSSSPPCEWRKSSLTSTSEDVESTFSLYRHILVSDMPDSLRQSLTSLIPSKITRQASNLDAFDPLPPQGAHTTRIDDEYFSALIRRTDPRGGGGGGTSGTGDRTVEVGSNGENGGMLERLQELVGQLQGRFPFFLGGGDGGTGGTGGRGGDGVEGEREAEAEAEARALMQRLLRDMPLDGGEERRAGMPGRFGHEDEGEEEEEEEEELVTDSE